MFVLSRTKRMQLRNHADPNNEAFRALKGLCNIYAALNLECWKCARMW